MTNKDYEPFVWANKSGVGLEGKRGYLVFSVGGATCADVAPGTGAIAAHAFQVKIASKDVAYTPVIDGPLTFDASATDLTVLGATSLTAVAGAAPVGHVLNMRYYLQDGAQTNIVVWSTGDQKGSHTVNIYNDKQDRKSVNFDLAFEELDWFDPSTIAGRPTDYTDGFIEWNTTNAMSSSGGLSGSVFSYSVIDAPAFGAVQTVLGFHKAP
ncbi:hypothetical protein ACX12L_11785 [Alicycliphilus sp. T452]